MRISAAIAAIALAAAPALAAGWSEATQFRNNWAPEVSLEKIAAVEAPAAPELPSPRDGQNYSGAEELLIMEFGINGIGMDIPEPEVIRQNFYYANTFCFEHALRQALTAVLEDYSDPTSPLARELAKAGTLSDPSKSELNKARRRLLQTLNGPASFIAMVRPYSQYQPGNGETVEKNWVFFVRVGGSSYWAVVERSGKKAPYVYGMD